MTPTQVQLAAALRELETAMREGEAELKADPAAYEQLQQLHAELKRLTPGKVPSAKVMALLQGLMGAQLDGEIADQEQLLGDAQARAGPLAMKDTTAHRETLAALTEARKGLATLSPGVPNEALTSAGVSVSNANQRAARAVADAEAAHALTPKGGSRS